MTDVVKIAKERRGLLQAEIARLDGFINIAEALVKYERELKRGEANEPEPAAPIALLSELSRSRMVGRDETPTGTSARAKDEAAATEEAHGAADDSNTPDDHFFFGPSAGKDEDLVLTDRVSDEDAVVDAHVGQRLRQRRWMLGMTKKQLAEKVGVEVERITRCELGEARVSSNDMWHIAAALGVAMSYFFEDGDKEAEEQDGVSAERSVPFEPEHEARIAQTA